MLLRYYYCDSYDVHMLLKNINDVGEKSKKLIVIQ